MTDPLGKAEDSLEGLTAEMFRKAVCPETDVLVVFVPKGKSLPPEVQSVLDESGPQRWFPVEGGNIVKCPHVVDTYDESIFKLERGGWDHEHCDSRRHTINTGDSCWIAEKADDFFLICDACYRELKRKKAHS